MPKNDNLIVALDIGTSKVTTLVATVSSDRKIQFVGKGVAENNKGMIAGSVINMDATREAIQKSITEAEKVSDIHIKSVVLGISGDHISSINNYGVVTVRGKEVAQTDVDRVIEQAKNISLPSDKRIVSVEIREFVVDERSGVKNPKGMAGKRLEVKLHIITASIAMIQNLVKCVADIGIQIEGIVVNSLASSYSVLEDDEKQLGVALVDIGEGTSDIIVYRNSAPVYTAVLPIGGKFITNDISYTLRIPPSDAEKIKCEFGSAVQNLVNPEEEFSVQIIGSRDNKIFRAQYLSGVISPRVEEIMMSIRKKINEDINIKESMIVSGVVLTGGTAKLKFIKVLAEEILGLPVRIGVPRVDDDSFGIASVLRDPEYASAVGIIKYFVFHGSNISKDSGNGFIDKLLKIFDKFIQ